MSGEGSARERYGDIIDLAHFHAPGKPFMKSSGRAAQFAPYKSLNGYYDMIDDAEVEARSIVWEEIEDFDE